MPLWLRRKQLSANYWINLRGHEDSHPTKKVLQKCWEKERRKKESFGWTGDLIAKEMEVYNKRFANTVLRPVKPIWTLEVLNVDLEFLLIKGSNRNIDIINEHYKYKNNKYKDSFQIFTDGSKDLQLDATGSVVYIPKYKMGISKRTSDNLNVYAVELCAVCIALEWIEQSRDSNIFVCSDSASALIYEDWKKLVIIKQYYRKSCL